MSEAVKTLRVEVPAVVLDRPPLTARMAIAESIYGGEPIQVVASIDRAWIWVERARRQPVAVSVADLIAALANVQDAHPAPRAPMKGGR